MQGGIDPKPVDAKIVKLADKYRSDSGKWKPGVSKTSMAQMPREDANRIIRASWKAFGTSGSTLDLNTKLNLRQATRESGLRPQVFNRFDVNGVASAGLFQMIPETFERWAVEGHDDRLNPLDSSLAVVNAQINSERVIGGNKDGILDGTSGWSAP